jgi:hypothetical protein
MGAPASSWPAYCIHGRHFGAPTRCVECPLAQAQPTFPAPIDHYGKRGSMITDDPTPIALGQLLDEATADTVTLAAAAKVPIQPPEWGGWCLYRGALRYPTSAHRNAYRYRIGLERISDPADALRWLAHVANKPWGDAAVVGLIRAFADVLDPAISGQDEPWLR